MSLSAIDTTKALRSSSDLLALVQAIYDSPAAAQETNWLEWKSELDFGTPDGRGTLAKAILGFANRSVAQASQWLEGVAYMVVGVEPGNSPGAQNLDHATLGQKLKTYVDGPDWTPHAIPFRGVTVLVAMVQPPQPGDPIHTLQKEYTKGKATFQAGTIFHRAVAHTEFAGPKVVAMLAERYAASAVADSIARIEALQESRHSAEEASQARQVAIVPAPIIRGQPGWEVRNDSDGPVTSIEVRAIEGGQVVVYHGAGPDWKDSYDVPPLAARQSSQLTFRAAAGRPGPGAPDPSEADLLILTFTDASDRRWERIGAQLRKV